MVRHIHALKKNMSPQILGGAVKLPLCMVGGGGGEGGQNWELPGVSCKLLGPPTLGGKEGGSETEQ